MVTIELELSTWAYKCQMMLILVSETQQCFELYTHEEKLCHLHSAAAAAAAAAACAAD